LRKLSLKQDDRAIVVGIDGSLELRAFLLANGVSIGTVFSVNYSPTFTHLINLTIGNKMMSLRMDDFTKIEWIKI